MIRYQVCNRPLRSDGTLYCEFDGDVEIRVSPDHFALYGVYWTCPVCGALRTYRDEQVEL